MHPCDNDESLLRLLQPPRRNHYFYGKRMDVQHFRMEQDYGKVKQWLLNRLTFGKGVVCGLKVSLDTGRLCVDPGFAIDGLGREIIVPTRACIDPVTQEGGCCQPCCSESEPPPRPDPDRPGTDDATGAAIPGAATHARPESGTHAEAAAQGLFTLWLCYKECTTDYQPVLVSDCSTRDPCAPGTIVESYCLKITAGLPPLQTDPEWCANLWAHEPTPEQPSEERPDLTHGNLQPANLSHASSNIAGAAMMNAYAAGANANTGQQLKDAAASRRRILCQLLDGKCDPPEGDPCVPLAVFVMRDNRVLAFDACLVRPRVYSNAVLLDLILCLVDKIEECCGDKPPPPPPPTAELMRVASVEFLGGRNNQEVIASVQSPLDDTQVPIGRQGRSIRVKFTKPFDQGANAPSAPNLNDPNFKRHNFLVLPERGPRFGLDYVPGTLHVVAPDTLRWDLHPETAYFDRQYNGWQKGRLRLAIFGDADAGAGRVAVSDTGAVALDGEPIAPAGGAMSGNGTAGGVFTLTFTVG